MHHTSSSARTIRIITGIIACGALAWMIGAAFGANNVYHLAEIHYNPYVWLSGSTLFLTLVLIGFMLRKQAWGEEGLWLWLGIGAITVIIAGEVMQCISVTPQAALFWVNFSTLGTFIAPATLLFALTYANQTGRRYFALAALLLVVAGLYIYMDSFTNLIFNNNPKAGMLEPWGWDFDDALGPAAAVSSIWYMGLGILAIARLIQFRRQVRGNTILRRQSLIFMIGLGLPAFGGTIPPLILPLLGINAVPPISSLSLPIAFAILMYGAYRYQAFTLNPAQFSTTILSLMKESVVVTDKNQAIAYLNPMAEKLLGTAQNEASRTTLNQYLSPDSATALQVALRSTIGSSTFDLPHLDLLHLHATATPIHVAGSRVSLGGFEVWIFVLTDITTELQTRRVIEHEVKVRTHQLHQARANLVASISSLQQGFLLVDASNKVELANDRANSLFTIGGDPVGMPLSEVTARMEWNFDLTREVGKVLESQHSKRLSVSSTAGSFYTIYITPVVLGTTTLGATIVVEDVTEAKILDRSKDEFFSIASHELRTPLTAIRGNMSMAKGYFAEALKDPALKELVDDTHAASVRLIEIVNDFLDSYKLEQGKMAFTFAPVQVAPLVDAVNGDLAVLVTQQHNTVTIDPSMAQLPPVMADEGRLRQIFYNLLSNANKYAEHATITISGEADAKHVRIRFIDTGKGISPENQKLLFHKFQQAGESILTRDNTKGTGLGLYISRLLAKNMHGTVELEHSEVGKGSTFTVILPIAKDA